MAHAFGAMMEAPSAYWLVAEEEQPIAFLSAEFRERPESWCLVSHRVCYLAGIVVAPEFRRRGIARALLTELKREADARGVAGIELDVWSFNEQAKRFFIRVGFQGLMERMTLVTHSSFLITPIIGLLLCIPKYLTGSMSLGEVVQAAAAFVVVQTAFNWFTDNYAKLAEWTASANRVASLLLALDEVKAPDRNGG